MAKSLAYYTLVLEKDFSALCNHRLNEIGLTRGLLYFILYIGNHPGSAMSHLIRDLQMDWGHAQRSIDRLTQDGFVLREKNEQDRRAYRLSLTPKGDEAFSLSHRLIADWDAGILGRLSDREREALLTLLEKLSIQRGGNDLVRNDQQPNDTRGAHTEEPRYLRADDNGTA